MVECLIAALAIDDTLLAADAVIESKILDGAVTTRFFLIQAVSNIL